MSKVQRARCGGKGGTGEMLKNSSQKRKMWDSKELKRGCKKTVVGMFLQLVI